MLSTDIYLHFNGRSEEAFTFYKTVFGGDFVISQRYKEMPGGDKMNVENLEKMMHISLKISPFTTLMASDLPSKEDQSLRFGNNFHICLQAESEKEADRLFNLLSKGGKIEMPMSRSFWGAYFGMCEDKFGILWMINSTYPNTNQ